jgi:hypothetical protein
MKAAKQYDSSLTRRAKERQRRQQPVDLVSLDNVDSQIERRLNLKLCNNERHHQYEQ